MKKTTKLILGIGTLTWPILIPLVSKLIQLMSPNFRFNWIVSVSLGWFCFTAFFVFITFHAMKNPTLTIAEKNRWMIYLLLCNIVAVPIYWYRHIWHATK